MAFNAALRIAARLMVVIAMMPFAFVGASQAQDYPTRPIRIIVPTQPGGMSDILSRLYAQKLAERTGATVVVENKTGANGVLAADYVAKSAPDGYTIYLGFQGTQSVLQHLDPKLPYDPAKDFAPVVLLASNPSILAVHPSFPARTVKEFVEVVKANPGKFNYASTGNGTGTHLAFAEFVARAGLKMEHVPYKGGPEAIQSVIAGQTCCIMNQVQTVIPHWKAGRVRLLGVTTKQRVQAISEIPTLAEAGVPGFESYTWFGLFGPKGLDAEIVGKVNAAVRSALETPSVQKRLVELGNTPRWESPEQFRQTVKSDREKWARVVKEVGATID